MDRMTLKEEIRQHFDCRDYLRKSSGCSLYICPSCGSGSRQHKTGAVKYYPDTQRWHCHRCKTLGDIFTIYELEHGVDFNVALWALAEQLGTSVEPHSTKPARKCPPAPSPVQSGSAPKDMSDYFAACRARLHDPAAVSFLSAQDGRDLWPWLRPQSRPGRKSPLLPANYHPDKLFPLRRTQYRPGCTTGVPDDE